LLAIGALVLLVACGGGGNRDADRAAIEDTIRGYVESFNASDFDRTLSYFTGFGDREDALAYLGVLREQSGELAIVNFDRAAIAFVSPTPSGATAKVPVDFVIQGQVGSQMLELKEEDTGWKILWEQ
jgi:hypothetical protein